MKKNWICMLLASVLVLSLLTACVSNPEEADTTVASSTAMSEAAASTASAAEGETDGDPSRVALIFGGVIAGDGWNEIAYEEMQLLAEEYNLEVSYQENVTEGNAADVIRNYASEGYDLVLDNEQYHSEIMAEIAPEFPDVTFGCVNGYVSADNMIVVSADMWQHVYLAGVMSGLATESNKLGLITYSTDSDSALTMLQAYGDGAKSVNENVEVVHVATGSFSDLAVGQELALSLMGQDCDVIFCNSGQSNVPVMEVSAENGVYAVGAILDHNAISEEYVLGSAMLNSDYMLRMIVEGYLDGSMTGSSEVPVMGIAEGVEEYRINPSMEEIFEPSMFEAIDEASAGIMDGSITIELP